MKPITSIWPKVFVLALCAVGGTTSAGEQSYIDYARVLHVDPISEVVTIPVNRDRCDYPQGALRADEALAGDVRTAQPDISIGAAIAEEVRHRERNGDVRHCRLVTTYEERDQIVAYRVRYAYGGDIHVRRMREHPGKRVQVRVRLNPL